MCLRRAHWDIESYTEKWDVGAILVEVNKGSCLHGIESRVLLDLETFPWGSKFLSTAPLIEFLN